MTLSQEIIDSIPSRVAAGVAWLNENEPLWVNKIDLGYLDMRDSCDCIGGQLAKFFSAFLARHKIGFETATALGLRCTHNKAGESMDALEEYRLLTAEWDRVVLKLQQADFNL